MITQSWRLLQRRLSDSDSDSDSDSSSAASSSASDASSKSSASDASQNWDSSSASSAASSNASSSDDDANPYKDLKGRDKWLKKAVVVKEKCVRAEFKPTDDSKPTTDEAEVTTDRAAPKVEEELTAAIVQRKMGEIVSSRGRKGNSSRSILAKLEGLAMAARPFGPRVEVPILMHVATAQFDLVRTLDDYMDSKTWKACAGYLDRIAGILEDGEADGGGRWRLGSSVGEDDDGLMIGNVLAKGGEGRMKDAAVVGDRGAMDAVAADRKLVNPHTVRLLFVEFHCISFVTATIVCYELVYRVITTSLLPERSSVACIMYQKCVTVKEW